jgi:hypothetical protein
MSAPQACCCCGEATAPADLYDGPHGDTCGGCLDAELSVDDESAYDCDAPDYAPDAIARRW